MSNKTARESKHFFDRRLIQQCPLCGGAFTDKETAVIEEFDGSGLVHITCRGCHSAFLTVVITTPAGASSICMVTDLSAEDARRVRQRPAIGEDELLNFHLLLKNSNSYDFCYRRA